MPCNDLYVPDVALSSSKPMLLFSFYPPPLNHPFIHTGAECLPCICCGPDIECDGMACIKAQLHACCCAITAAFPCDKEVPALVTIAGLTLYPKTGCCMPIKEAMGRE